MSELVAIGYPDLATAQRVLEALGPLELDRAVALEDAVIVERRPDGQVAVHPGVHVAGLETASTALIGGMIGALFFAPLLGAAIGAAAGATRAGLQDLGIPDGFMQHLGASLSPGGAALILLARASAPEKVLSLLSDYGGRVLRTSLTPAAEERLRIALGR